MGRKKKYLTPADRQEANRASCKNYYAKNREAVCAKRMERYWAAKQEKKT